MDVYISTTDTSEGKVLKYFKPNPAGEDAYLIPDGSVVFDEDKIRRAQQIFKHNYYKPGGKGARKTLKKYESRSAQESQDGAISR